MFLSSPGPDLGCSHVGDTENPGWKEKEEAHYGVEVARRHVRTRAFEVCRNEKGGWNDFSVK